MIKYLVTICLMLLLYTNSALAMPPIMTTSELKPGMQGYAETVVQGAQRFRMEKPDAGGGKLHVLKKLFNGKVRKLWH